MAHYNVVIETRETSEGTYIAAVTDGPKWLQRGNWARASDRQGALEMARGLVRGEWRKHSFDFLHVQSDTERDG